jgi:hypothetical protein
MQALSLRSSEATLNGHFIIGDPALGTADLAAYVESVGR